MGANKNVVYWAKPPLNGSLLQKCNTSASIILFGQMQIIQKVFMNPMHVLHLKRKTLCVIWECHVGFAL
jgi:hypothetical protein